MVGHQILFRRLQTSFGIYGRHRVGIFLFLYDRPDRPSFVAKIHTLSDWMSCLRRTSSIDVGPRLFYLCTANLIALTDEHSLSSRLGDDDTGYTDFFPRLWVSIWVGVLETEVQFDDSIAVRRHCVPDAFASTKSPQGRSRIKSKSTPTRPNSSCGAQLVDANSV